MAIKSKQQSGMSLSGLLIAMAIITTALIYLLGIINFSFKAFVEKEHFYQAGFMAQEAMEATRSFRDSTNWSSDGLGTVNLLTSYHFEQSGSPSAWVLVSGEEVLDRFTRKVIFYEVRRDPDGNIILSGGGVDINSKRAKVIVSWQESGVLESVEFESYFTNWQ